jgi:hypothetical protein
MLLDYDVRRFNGKKFVIFTTSTILGTASFFGYTLIAAGVYCSCVFLVLLYLFIKNNGKRYDYTDLKWS